MQFLADMNGLTVLLTGLSVLLVFVFLGLLWGSYGNKWPVENVRILGILLAAATFSFAFAYKAYCPDADQPHIQRTGPITLYKPYTYRVGKSGTGYGILVCVGPYSREVPLMEFDAHIKARLAHRDFSNALTLTYLGRKEPANIGNGYTITAHPVVQIDDPATGERIFYIDTTRHWPRVIVLLADALITLLTFWICIRKCGADAGSGEDDGSSVQSDRDHSMPDELTELGLGSEDRQRP